MTEPEASGNGNETTTCYKIIIIGAGVAGLSAANNLIKNGINDFLILEARNRIGGRIIAINIEGRQLELGANWIHGVLGNPIYEVASSNGLVPIVQNPHPHTVLAAMEDGSQLPFAILQEMYEVYGVFLKRCEEYYLCRYLPPQGVVSVGQHLRLERDLYLQQLPEHQRQSRHLVFEYLMHREMCITGAGDLDRVDLMEVGSYTELPGGNISLPSGYSSILQPLTREIPLEKILKGHAVSVVRWKRGSRHGAGVNTREPDDIAGQCSESQNDESISEKCKRTTKQMIEIVCENGKSFYCESVICAVPLGVLKQNARTLFDPHLPESMMNSIDKLCFGTVDKIYLEYDRPFFSSELGELILLWDKTDPELDMAKKWYRKIYSFTKLSDTLLLAWLSGEEAKYMETLPFEVVSNKCTEILRQFLADPFVPKPKRCICTSWWSQPYSRGSYSCIGVGGTQADMLNLATPLWGEEQQHVPSLVLAGEHCHPSFYSTVHGAYLSGRDAALYCCRPSPAATVGTASGNTPDGLHGKDGEQEELTLTVEGTADLSSWLHGISLH